MLSVKFHKSIYTSKGVKLAIEKFKSFFQCKITRSPQHIEVKIELPAGKEKSGKIIDEFKNYALFASIDHDQV